MEVPTAKERVTLVELYHIYDASGTVAGEILYHVKKLMGSSCSACDISHLKTGEKPEFSKWRAEFPVPVKTLHRDELDVSLYSNTAEYPCVMAKVRTKLMTTKYICIMSRGMLDVCGASVAVFVEKLEESLSHLGVDVRRPKRSRLEAGGDVGVKVQRLNNVPDGKGARGPALPKNISTQRFACEDDQQEETESQAASDAVVPAL